MPPPSEEKRGPPRVLGRPLPTCRGRTPRRTPPALAYFSCGQVAVAFKLNRTLGIRNDPRLRGRCPSARTLGRIYASPTALPRPSQDSLPAGAVLPFAGRDSHPLDDIPNFMNSSHHSLLSDSQIVPESYSGAAFHNHRDKALGRLMRRMVGSATSLELKELAGHLD